MRGPAPHSTVRPAAQAVRSTGRLAWTRCGACPFPFRALARETLTHVCGQFGSPHFVNLSDAISTWSAAYGKEAPAWSAEKWSRPDDEAAKLSLQGKFVDAVLNAPFDPPECTKSLCHSLTRELDAANASDSFPWQCCMLKFSALTDNRASTEAAVNADVAELVETWAGRVTKCFDLLGSGEPFLSALSEGVAMLTIVATMDQTGASCTERCPFFRPLCKGGMCVQPTCSDLSSGLRPLCMSPSNAGAMARLMCSQTCGCSGPLSPLLTTGQKYGCLSACQNVREATQMLGTKNSGDGKFKCTDAQPNSTELTALAQFGTSKAVIELFNLDDSANATLLWTTLGCFAVNVYDRKTLCDHDGIMRQTGMKSFMPFCPVTCGCTSDRLRDDVKATCPSPCQAIVSPSWDFHDDPPVADYVESHSTAWTVSGSRIYDDSVSAFVQRISAGAVPPAGAFLPPAGAAEAAVATHLRELYGKSIWKHTLLTRFALGVHPSALHPRSACLPSASLLFPCPSASPLPLPLLASPPSPPLPVQGVSVSVTEPTCQDTDGWDNLHGENCASYESKKWCVDGSFTVGNEWNGQRGGPGKFATDCLPGQDCAPPFNYPADNCCVCGKKAGPCVDLSEDQLAAANRIIDANPRWNKPRYPGSCSAVNPTICSELLDGSFVFGGKPDSKPHSLQLHNSAHPCPKACDSCPNYDPVVGYKRKKACFNAIAVTGAEASTTHWNYGTMGTYMRVGDMKWGCAMVNPSDKCPAPLPGDPKASDGSVRPIYKRVRDVRLTNRNESYLYYWAGFGNWLIGPDYKQGAAWAMSTGSSKELCPELAVRWSTWLAEEQDIRPPGFVDKYKITIALSAGAL